MKATKDTAPGGPATLCMDEQELRALAEDLHGLLERGELGPSAENRFRCLFNLLAPLVPDEDENEVHHGQR